MITLPVTSKGQKRSHAIIQAAKQSFIAKGFEGTSIDQILAISGGSRSSIYDIFGGKEGLFLAVAQDILQSNFSPIYLTEPIKQIETVLKQYGQQYMAKIFAPDSLGLFRLIIAESNRFPELSHRCYVQGLHKYRQALGDALQKTNTLNAEKKFYSSFAQVYLEMLQGSLFLQALSNPDFVITQAMIDEKIAFSISLIKPYFSMYPKNTSPDIPL